MATVMKLSFDEDHRHSVCQLGGLQAIAELVQLEHEAHGPAGDPCCSTLRRYAGMALTNLTFGDGTNKALLCSYRGFARALVSQLYSPSEDLRQVTASVLRNLSWRADSGSKAVLQEVGTVSALMQAAMEAKRESTLKSILSALWNLSAHCGENKAEICAFEGALAFLVSMLSYNAPSKTLAVVENSGGILRNISSQIALSDEYRQILREGKCLETLLQQLKSPSLTVVSNACGTLWNLSARCTRDQHRLWELGAVPMLKSLIHSKHKMISLGSSAALKNLMSGPPRPLQNPLTLSGLDVPTLQARKQKALTQHLENQNLTETCENIESPTSPAVERSVTAAFDRRANRFYNSLRGHSSQSMYGNGPVNGILRSESHESIRSTHSESYCERWRHRSGDISLYGNLPSDPTLQPLDLSRKSNNNLTRNNSNNNNSIMSDQEFAERISKLSETYLKSETFGSLPRRHSADILDPRNVGVIAPHPTVSGSDSAMAQPGVRRSLSSDRCSIPAHPNSAFEPYQHGVKVKNYATERPLDFSLKGDDSKSAYTETDLDEPVNYSLRFSEGEQDESEDEKLFKKPLPPNVNAYVEPLSIHDDSVKTYCTEGTPYMISNAGSLSDLTADDKSELGAKKIRLISGRASPEKPKTYCVEDTPANLSHRSSLSNIVVSLDKDGPKLPQESSSAVPEGEKVDESSQKAGGKSVTFRPGAPEETPLMFSRCSSLDSLSSADQHSLHDDRNSVVSEYSRRTSEVVSPSDLPDSPGQTMPPSPRQRKPPPPPLEQDLKTQIHAGTEAKDGDTPDVFAENLKTYETEGTPFKHSRATSLSSLTIDDDTSRVNGMAQVGMLSGD
ncbi:unnamed protein product [Darwinula stevensoni]|uniref:Adenomatous polyposis coli protein n=1 Tax=Darwinula stevensoni TaxID=69355 RepID=A0A7R9FRU3_9CRUS|nr:unnamed protein product [Darwinula stevensoni]CAG0902403.1 unnamed protein product [Darwinula stevensoni]